MKNNIKDYDHIIWDWNGTLFNDVDLCAAIMNHLLRSEALPEISIEHYKNIFTFPVVEYYKIAGHTFRNRSFDELGKEFMVKYEEQKLSCNLYVVTSDILKQIHSLKIEQHLLSAYEQNSLNNILNHYNLTQFFSNVIGLDNIYATGKAHLAKNLNLKLRMNGNPDNILLIGDTVHDYEVASENDWDCILIADGHQSKEKLVSTGALVLNNLNEFKNLISKKEFNWER